MNGVEGDVAFERTSYGVRRARIATADGDIRVLEADDADRVRVFSGPMTAEVPRTPDGAIAAAGYFSGRLWFSGVCLDGVTEEQWQHAVAWVLDGIDSEELESART